MTDDGSPTRTVASVLGGGDGPASPATRSGEHRLMLAILEDAVALHVKSRSGGIVTRRHAREAREWFRSRDRSWPFAFESICDVLGLDSSYVRRGIQGARMSPAKAAARFARRHLGRRAPLAVPSSSMTSPDPRPAVSKVA